MAANSHLASSPDEQHQQLHSPDETMNTSHQGSTDVPATPPDLGANDPPSTMDDRQRVEGLLRAATAGIDPSVLITIHRKNLATIVGRREFLVIRPAITNGWVPKVASWHGHALHAVCNAAGTRAHRALVAALGASAAHPTLDELRSAVCSAQSSVAESEIIAALAAVMWIDAPAAPHALVILSEDFALEPLSRSAAAPNAKPALTPTPRPQSNPTRAAAKAAKRKAVAEANAKAAEIAEAATVKRRTGKADRAESVVEPETAPTFAGRGTRPAVDRRPAKLTPKEAETFTTSDPLVGAIVEVDVRYHFHDPAEPDVRSKFRPAVIVAVSADRFLVRGIYSRPKEWTAEFTGWHKFGLNRERCNVAMVNEESMSRVIDRTRGRLSDEAWNQLW